MVNWSLRISMRAIFDLRLNNNKYINFNLPKTLLLFSIYSSGSFRDLLHFLHFLFGFVVLFVVVILVDSNDVVLVSLLITLNMFHPCSSVSIVNFEHVLASWLNWKQQNLRLLTIENINFNLPKQKYIFSIYCMGG